MLLLVSSASKAAEVENRQHEEIKANHLHFGAQSRNCQSAWLVFFYFSGTILYGNYQV